MRKIAALLLSTLAFSAHAGLPGVEGAFGRTILDAQQRILSDGGLSSSLNKECTNQISNMSADGQIDIVMAFGYMDVSGGPELAVGQNNLYSVGNTLDDDARAAMESVLTGPCEGGLGACGFRGRSGSLSKTITDRFTNRRIRVNVRLASPSISPVDEVNRKSPQQLTRSKQVRATFLSGLQSADAVLYLGHARSGGGPDFYPPVYALNGHVNYPYYRSKREGISAMLGALKQAARRPSVLGVLACKSKGLFAGSIRKQAPGSILITATDLFDYNDILPTGYSIVEAVVSQACGQGFSKISKSSAPVVVEF